MADNTSNARRRTFWSRVRAAVGVGVVAGVTLVVPLGAVTAHASPIDDKRAQAQALQDQIDQNGQKISALSEQYDGAQLKLQAAQQAAADAELRIAATKAETARLKKLVKRRAASVYMQAVSGSGFGQYDLSNKSELEVRNKYADIASERDDALVSQLVVAKEQLNAQKAAAEQAQAAAQQERDQISQAKSAIEAANAQQQQLLSQVKGELAQLIAQEQARRAAAAAAAARARFSAGTARTAAAVDPGSVPNVPPPSPRAAQAIAFARAQLGKPYVYAASGPDSYDCSGLTMAAWGAAGVSLPHYSGAQYAMLPKVPLDQMQPGDLVFWGPGGSDHVGIYVGDGMMIHAPHTGDVVRVAAVYGSPVGAARPG
ncbi:MAG TPA: C40 family peptidase [Acidimicrobiia bacterium]|nr:C40 family peptidase [Acidimicrobiia bacterium]